MQLFEVGGCVRDEILGIPSKDIDFTVVLSPDNYADPFGHMVWLLKERGFTIFVESPEFLTARGRFPKNHSQYPNMAADFVLARKESDYSDGRRPDKVVPGTLGDDLKRRDFTVNAIAKDMAGGLIDPHNGVRDIRLKVIKAVGNPMERLQEDALRALRAVRFSVTKGFHIESTLYLSIESPVIHDAIVNNISDERIADELSKMFRFDTLKSLSVLKDFPSLSEAIFSGKVSLDATLKTKGRG